jgi:hypothetical protein
MISLSDVLSSISDEKTLDIFNTIAVLKKKDDIYSMKEQNKLTKKQYYSRMHKLSVAGLIKRTNGKYFLTTFGKLIHEHYVGIQNAVNAYSKLSALDEILKNDNKDDFSTKQRLEIIERLIQDTEIKKSILKMV